VCTGERGVLHYQHDRWQRESRLPEQACSSLALDASGQLLLGYADGRLRRMSANRIENFDASQGLSVGPITAMLHQQDLLLVAGEAGLAARVGNGRFVPVRTDMAGVLEGITGMVADANGHLWLNGSRGLVRMESGLLRRALRSGLPVTPRLFDAIDGMPGIALQSGPIATAALADDGLLWLATNQGLAWLDTTRSHVNSMPPSVRIGDVLYGSKHELLRDGLRLPAGTSQLQIDYVALSLARPERNRYRYRLSGVDDGWQDAGSSTRAYYTNLAAGNYRFEVEAANEDGIWSTAPASRSFRIAPTFMQTVWFKLLCAAAILALLMMAVRIRSGQLAALFRARLQERNGERERIARDLHAGFADIEWVISAYILSFTSLLLPAGAVADRYGRRRVLLIGISLFALTSLLCALAPGATLLYLARALQGIGAAFLLAPSLSIIGHTYHQGAAKDTAWAFWGTAMGVMMVLSPLIGLIAMVGYSVSAQVMASMLPQYLQNGIGLGVLAAGAGMLPFAAAMLLFPSVGRRLGRHLNSPAVLAIGLSITAAGNAVAGLAAWQHLPWLAFVAMVVIGAGGGILNGETSKAIIGAAPRERAGMASGISATTRFVGILLGFTVLSSALSLGIRNALSAVGPARDVLSMADAIATGTFTGARNMAFAQAIYSHGFASALWTSAIAALLASLAVLLLGRSPAQR